MSKCFYCGVELIPSRTFDSHIHDREAIQTTDHIYAASLLATLTGAQKGRLPTLFYALNTVKVCARDNYYKAHLHPLDWLVIMPSNAGAKRLAERLVAMGEDMAEVFDCLRRRRR